MIEAFKAKFGDQWNDEWTVAELGNYLDTYLENVNCTAVAQHIDYGSVISSLCYDNFTVWKFVENANGKPSFNCKFNEDEIARPERTYSADGSPCVRCATDGLFVITDADMYLYKDDVEVSTLE
jgi:hypothetical protein